MCKDNKPLSLPEHVRDRIVANIIGDPYPPLEEFNGQMSRVPSVEQHAVLLGGAEVQGHIGGRPGLEGLQGEVGVIGSKVDSCQILTVLACAGEREDKAWMECY